MNTINKDIALPGIYRAKLLNDNRIYVPSMSNLNPINQDGTINQEIVSQNIDTFPKAVFCAPSEASITTVTPPASCWVTYEIGDGKRPVILGYLGKSIPEVTFAGSFGSAGGTASESMISDNAKKIMELLINKCGLTVAAASGILGNIMVENPSLDPTFEMTDSNGLMSMGIFMFNEDGHGGANFENLKAHCGSYEYNTIEGQIEYLKQWFNDEISGMYLTNKYGDEAKGSNVKASLNNVPDSEEGAAKAAEIFVKMFENPKDVSASLSTRQTNARNAYNLYKNGKTEDGKYTAPEFKSNSEVVNIAREYLGVPYVWGGTSPSGFDCSGLVQYCFNKIGISLPRVAEAQYRDAKNKRYLITSIDQLQPGDLVYFSDSGDDSTTISHIGIYSGDGQMIHAPHTGDVVKYSYITTDYYKQRFVAGGRYIS